MGTTMYDMFSNYVLNSAILSWILAQVAKTIINLIKTKEFNVERLVGAGGMPSAHSASVCAMVIALARSAGIASPVFAVAFMLAAIVMYDAMGVRRAAGEQAKILNLMVKKDKEKKLTEYMPEKKGELKEFLGHTPLQVLGGALLGILVAMLLPVM